MSQQSKSTRFLRRVQLASLIFLLAGAGRVAAQQRFGYVLDVRGNWVMNNSVTLSKGSAVNVGASISTASPSDASSYIVIADRNGAVFVRKTCANAGECAAPIQIPKSAGAEQGVVSRIIGAAMALVSSEPSKYASFISRGSSELREGVAKLDGEQLDLSSVFKNMGGEHYLVRFEVIRKGTGTASELKPPRPYDYAWDPDKPQPLSAKGLAPGLYRISLLEVSLLEPESGGEPTANEAWVFVAGPRDYPRAASEFDAAAKVAKQWDSSVKQSAVREFLRAALEVITTQNKP